jgi:hypothetical protein
VLCDDVERRSEHLDVHSLALLQLAQLLLGRVLPLNEFEAGHVAPTIASASVVRYTAASSGVRN